MDMFHVYIGTEFRHIGRNTDLNDNQIAFYNRPAIKMFLAIWYNYLLLIKFVVSYVTDIIQSNIERNHNKNRENMKQEGK